MSYNEKLAGKVRKRFPPWEMNKEKINLVPCPEAFFLLDKVWRGCKSWSWASHLGTMRGNQEICREANPDIKELLTLHSGNLWASYYVQQQMSYTCKLLIAITSILTITLGNCASKTVKCFDNLLYNSQYLFLFLSVSFLTPSFIFLFSLYWFKWLYRNSALVILCCCHCCWCYIV